MLVSWEWLSQYVYLKNTPDEIANRLSLSGLNHEETKTVDGDTVLDLEVTSNRADCLCHIGIAREIGVLTQQQLCLPEAKITTSGEDITKSWKLNVEAPTACPRYTGRIIRGVKVGPSPAWLVKRLAAIGCKSVNNIVDVTNYVMFELGQPLHAFDLRHVRGNQVVVRMAKEGEQLVAIDHKQYKLDPSMVVIADAQRALALGGIMGGADSEVSGSTVDLLIEAADFAPRVIRSTARALKLHSPSSFRFERRIDARQLDWASRRCCELIVQVAGGTIQNGLLDSATTAIEPPAPFAFRCSEIERVLGITIPITEVTRIIPALGCKLVDEGNGKYLITPPTWRADLTREIDMVEELARIYGYEQIPENVPVPMFSSAKRPKDVVLERVRGVMIATGLDEALTPSVVTQANDEMLSPWTDLAALSTDIALLEGATRLRRSLIPSLLTCRLHNQAQSARDADLFEVAQIYLPSAEGGLPLEQCTLGWVSGSNFNTTKGILESLLESVCGVQNWTFADWSNKLLEAGEGAKLQLNGETLGYVGTFSKSGRKELRLEGTCSFVEISVDGLLALARIVPTAKIISPYPAVVRDLNLVLDEACRWHQLSETVRAAGGELLKDLQYRETYRDANKDGEGKKRVLFSFALQSDDRTLTSQEADDCVKRIIQSCEQSLGGRLIAS
ncbi:MAG: phenylalanine--tRNA ligase subunit beta [Planctomycetes bacterium]|nr:phenylalanine--tRNA ligase subunit beta [Planctomycetota bacterium]